MIFMDTVADACLFHVLGGKKKETMGKKGSPEAVFDDYFF